MRSGQPELLIFSWFLFLRVFLLLNPLPGVLRISRICRPGCGGSPIPGGRESRLLLRRAYCLGLWSDQTSAVTAEHALLIKREDEYSNPARHENYGSDDERPPNSGSATFATLTTDAAGLAIELVPDRTQFSVPSVSRIGSTEPLPSRSSAVELSISGSPPCSVAIPGRHSIADAVECNTSSLS